MGKSSVVVAKQIRNLARRSGIDAAVSLAKTLKSHYELQGWKDLDHLPEPSDSLAIANRIRNANLDYERRMASARFDHYSLETNSAMVRNALWGGLASATVASGGALAPVLVAAGVVYGLEVLMDHAADQQLSHATEAAEKTFRFQLRRMQEESGEAFEAWAEGIHQAARSEDPQRMAEAVKEGMAKFTDPENGIFSGGALDGQDEDRKELVRITLQKVFEQKMNSALDLLGEATAGNSIQIAQLRKDVNSAHVQVQSLRKGVAANAMAVKRLALGMQHLGDKVQKLSEQVGKNRSDIVNINLLLFSKASPEEQLVLLERQNNLPLTAAEKARIKVELEAVRAKQEFIDAAASVTNTASEIANIATNLADELGLDPKLVSGINKAAQVGRQLATGVGKLLTGDVLGAASAVIGALFGGGQDAAAKRHEEIMEKFEEVLGNQRAILDDLRTVKRALSEVLRNQVEILENVAQLRLEMREGFAQSMQSHLLTQRMVSVVGTLALEVVIVPLRNMEVFLGDRKNYPHDESGRLTNWSAVRAHWLTNRDLFSGDSGFEGFRLSLAGDEVRPQFLSQTMLMLEGSITEDIWSESWLDPTFLSSRRSTPDTAVSSLVEDGAVHLKRERAAAAMWSVITRAHALRIWADLHMSGPDARLRLAQALNPSLDVVACATRLIATADGPAEDIRDQEWILKNLHRVVDAEIVLRHARVALGVYPYPNIADIDGDNELYPFDDPEHSEFPEPNERGRRLLEDALHLVNLAVIQAAVTGGEGLLPYLTTTILKPREELSDEEAAEWDACFWLLKDNPTLRQNWTRYLFRNLCFHPESEVGVVSLKHYRDMANRWRRPDLFAYVLRQAWVPVSSEEGVPGHRLATMPWKLRWDYRGYALRPGATEPVKWGSVTNAGRWIIRESGGLPDGELDPGNELYVWRVVFERDRRAPEGQRELVLEMPSPSAIAGGTGSLVPAGELQDLVDVREQLMEALVDLELWSEPSVPENSDARAGGEDLRDVLVAGMLLESTPPFP